MLLLIVWCIDSEMNFGYRENSRNIIFSKYRALNNYVLIVSKGRVLYI